jgi:hypothetical protein
VTIKVGAVLRAMRGDVSQREIGKRVGGMYASAISDLERGFGRARFGVPRIAEIVCLYVEVCAARWATDPDDTGEAVRLYAEMGLAPVEVGADPRAAAQQLGDAVFSALVGGGAP